MASAESSRDMTIVSLGIVGIYFYLSGYNLKWTKISSFVLVALVCLSLLPLGANDKKFMRVFILMEKQPGKPVT